MKNGRRLLAYCKNNSPHLLCHLLWKLPVQILFVAYPSYAEAFEPHPNTPADTKELILFYHRKTWNTTEKGGMKKKKSPVDATARAQPRTGWANQPTIHRRWFECPQHQLECRTKEEVAQTPLYNDLWKGGKIPSKKLSLSTISDFFFFSLACSGRKDPSSSSCEHNL